MKVIGEVSMGSKVSRTFFTDVFGAKQSSHTVCCSQACTLNWTGAAESEACMKADVCDLSCALLLSSAFINQLMYSGMYVACRLYFKVQP